MRTIGHQVTEIARTSRSKGTQVQEKLKQGCRKLLTVTRKVVNQAKRFREELASGVKRAKDLEQKLVLRTLRKDLELMLPRVQQVIRQAKARVLGGDVHVTGKLVSVFEPSTEVIRKGKASKPTEFGKTVKVQEAENQIITHYEVFEKRPNYADLLVPAVRQHEEQFGRVPKLVAGDAGFYSAHNETELREMGVRQISVPNRSTKSPERRRHATVGGLGSDRRQSDQYWPVSGSDEQRIEIEWRSAITKRGKNKDGEKMSARKEPAGCVQDFTSPQSLFLRRKVASASRN